MYDELETNIPRQWMSYSDAPFSAGDQLFPPRQVVSAYLEEYAKDVRHLIKFHTQVLDVRVETSDKDDWSVRTKNLLSGQERVDQYDAVAICSGHYTVPYTPAVPGMEKWKTERPGSIIHSKYFRRSEPYANQKVLVVGNSKSALDISAHIKRTSKTPVLMSERSKSVSEASLPDVRPVPQIAEFLDLSSDCRAVRLVDGSVEVDVDRVVYCTGYLYSYPFLTSLGQSIITDGTRVHNTYQHLFNIDHPTLTFHLLNLRVQPFPLSEVQAAAVARVWSGRLSLPSKKDMQAWEVATLKENGEGKGFHTLAHPKDYDYQNMLYDWASTTDQNVGKLGHRWNERDYWFRKKFLDLRLAFVARGAGRYEVKYAEDLGFNYNTQKQDQEQKTL